jgi:hypothetical protein
MRRRSPEGQQFYQTYFQIPGAAEKEFDADPRRTLRMFLYSLSGSIPKEHKWRYMFGVEEEALDGCVDPKQLPAWLRPEDLEYYANEYSRTGFRGGLSWYRGQDIFWQETPFLIGRKLLQPTLYVGGTDDPWSSSRGPTLTTWRRAFRISGTGSCCRALGTGPSRKRRLR